MVHSQINVTVNGVAQGTILNKIGWVDDYKLERLCLERMFGSVKNLCLMKLHKDLQIDLHFVKFIWIPGITLYKNVGSFLLSIS